MMPPNNIIHSIFFLLLIMIIPISIGSEIIYLNDGQVIKGAIIEEKSDSITVKTRYQTRRVRRNHIKRIMYGDRDMERIYILFNNGDIINGFLVDQDAKQVIYRESKDSAEEKSIPKSIIKQISNKEIIPLFPEIIFRAGLFVPIDSGGSELGSAPLYIVGLGFNLSWIKGLRLITETGFVKSESKSNENGYFQIVPIVISITGSISIPYIDLVPKVGMGIAVVDYDNGDGEKFRGYDLDMTAGVGAVYEITARSVYAGIWFEYKMLAEASTVMNNILLSAGLSYRL